MELGSIVLFVEIMLLIAGWLLFQHARTELTARAAQVPVLSEVRALQKSIAALLEQLKLEADQTAAQLEARCAEARDLLDALDRRLEEIQPTPVHTARPPDGPVAAIPAVSPRYQEVYTLADSGLAPPSIARRTGFTEGEIELILGLRRQTS
jgi:hypothetical protein